MDATSIDHTLHPSAQQQQQPVAPEVEMHDATRDQCSITSSSGGIAGDGGNTSGQGAQDVPTVPAWFAKLIAHTEDEDVRELLRLYQNNLATGELKTVPGLQGTTKEELVKYYGVHRSHASAIKFAFPSPGQVSVPVLSNLLVGDTNDGINHRPGHTKRHATCVQLAQLLLKHGVVMLQGQPRSGKTSLMQLLARMVAQGHLRQNFSTAIYINCARMADGQTWADFFNDRTDGINWHKLLRRPQTGRDLRGDQRPADISDKRKLAEFCPPDVDSSLPVLLLCDELSSTYNNWQNMHELHAVIKSLKSADDVPVRILGASIFGGSPSHCHTLDGSSVRGITPFDGVTTVMFEPVGDLPCLKLVPDEHNELWGKSFDNFPHPYPIFADNSTRDEVYKLTGGQVGVHVFITDKLTDIIKRQTQTAESRSEAERLRKMGECVGDAAYRWLVNSGDIYSALVGMRSFLNFSELSSSVQVRDEVFDKLLLSSDPCEEGVSMAGLSLQGRELVDKMYSSGYIRKTEVEGLTYYNVFTNLHLLYYDHQLRNARVNRVVDEDSVKSLRQFLIASFRRISKSELQNTLSLGKDRQKLLERKIQMAFCTAATSILPEDWKICPDVGKVFDISGLIDFWLSQKGRPKGRGLEFVMNGVDLLEHERRFQFGGKYYPLLGEADAVAVVDFRPPNSPRPRGRVSDITYFIVFPDNSYDSALLIKANTLESWPLYMAD